MKNSLLKSLSASFFSVSLIFAALLSASSASATMYSSPPSCGTLGCPKLFVEVMPYALLDPDLRAIKGPDKIASVTRKMALAGEKFQITTESGNHYCVATEYSEMPVKIDGKSTVNVQGRNVLFTASFGRCKY